MKRNVKIIFHLLTFLFLPFICFAFERWPDTGQTTSYTDTFGEDSDYAGNSRSYTKLGNKLIELPDEATHLDGWIMTKDNTTGLIWTTSKTEFFTTLSIGDFNFASIRTLELNKSNHGGFSDWRLPSFKELSSIIDYNIKTIPHLNTKFFPYIKTDEKPFWVSFQEKEKKFQIQGLMNSLGVVIWTGITGVTSKSLTGFYMHVRGDELEEPIFIDHVDGTITDTNTGLMWIQTQKAIHSNWEEAIQYCETLSFAGYDDWRLPNINELHSLVDYSKYHERLITSPPFDSDLTYCVFWSSTSSSHASLSEDEAYVLYTKTLTVGLGSKIRTPSFFGACTLCVRVGNYETPLIKGDINRDGRVNFEDSTTVLKVLSSQNNFADSKADVNDDGKIGLEDELFILDNLLKSTENN